MQYASTRGPQPVAASPFGYAMSALLVLTLVVVVAGSTVTAQWVAGSAVLPNVSLLAAAVSAPLALLKRWVSAPLGLAAWILPAPLLVYLMGHPSAHYYYPDSHLSLATVVQALSKRDAGALVSDSAIFFYGLMLGLWMISGWLTWCVLRWRQPLLGLIPGAGLLATNVINYPENQNPDVFVFLVAVLLLMLWTSYQTSVEAASGHRMRFADDVRPAFWTSGAAAMIVVLAVGLLLPPMSHVDKTISIQSGPVKLWADLLNRLNRPVQIPTTSSRATSTGLALDVAMGGPIRRTNGVVLTYTINSPYTGPTYFRALNLVATEAGRWRYDPESARWQKLDANVVAPFAEQYRDQSLATFTITMLHPPGVAPNVLVYPGELARVDRGSTALQSLPSREARLDTVDRLNGQNGGAGTYHVEVTYSTASAAELQSAGSGYPAWVDLYRQLPGQVPLPSTKMAGAVAGSPYRPAPVMDRVRQLALQVTARATNPYDKARLIEQYLRSSFTYTLSPPVPPAGTDPVDYFLFHSKVGYCEYFATAMGDMLRALNIPARLVNGYAGGVYDSSHARFVVNDDAAHTWVEVYFPHYGWIPFEPTPDQVHFPIVRGGSAVNAICRGETACDAATAARTGQLQQLPLGVRQANEAPLGNVKPSPGGPGFRLPSVPWPPLPAALAVLAVLLLAGLARVFDWLRPRSAAQAWRRLVLLSRLAGVPALPGDTPAQVACRLALAFPEGSAPFTRLAADYAVVAYAPTELAEERMPHVIGSWREVRPLLLRRILRRLRHRR